RDHQLVQLDHLVDVLREVGQVLAYLLAVGVEVLQVFDFKLGCDGHGMLPVGSDSIGPARRAASRPLATDVSAKAGRPLSHACIPIRRLWTCCNAARDLRWFDGGHRAPMRTPR